MRFVFHPDKSYKMDISGVTSYRILGPRKGPDSADSGVSFLVVCRHEEETTPNISKHAWRMIPFSKWLITMVMT